MDSPQIPHFPINPRRHPLVHDFNSDRLSPVELACQRIADGTGSPPALALAVILQAIWIPFGIYTKLDPYPFAFLLTCSNVIQLILIFVLAVGQRQSVRHTELRAEHDHACISRLLYHQELQEEVLLDLAGKAGVDVDQITKRVAQLAAGDPHDFEPYSERPS